MKIIAGQADLFSPTAAVDSSTLIVQAQDDQDEPDVEDPPRLPDADPGERVYRGPWCDENGLCSEKCAAARKTDAVWPMKGQEGRWYDCLVQGWRVTPGLTPCFVRTLHEALKRGPAVR